MPRREMTDRMCPQCAHAMSVIRSSQPEDENEYDCPNCGISVTETYWTELYLASLKADPLNKPIKEPRNNEANEERYA